MISKLDALTENEFHAEGGCIRTVGPRGGVTVRMEVWRRNGQTKTWRRDDGAYRVPVKYGFRGPYGYVRNDDAQYWHTRANCPLNEGR